MADTLRDLASTIRSKNAGPDNITFDVIFRDRANFERVRDSGALSRAAVAALYDIPPARIVNFDVIDAASAIKFTIRRLQPSGTPGESDVFGSQQYAPLFDVVIP
ncbi:MAG: DUF4387 domain-containing protein [Rhodobacteraceae bacterium]|nr:DUF4387 domain-containing protein [Paracoccaceae bacterium]